MSAIDEVLAANEFYSRTHELRRLTPRPERKLAVLTCMDTRLSIRTMGLREGDAHIIRNAGGIVTDDALRSLLVSHYLLDTEEFMVINHTDCGLMHTTRAGPAHAHPESRGNGRRRPRLLLRIPEYRGECPAPATETALASVDSREHRRPRLRLRCRERPPPRNRV